MLATTLVPALPPLAPYRIVGPGWTLIAGSLGNDRLRGSNDSEVMLGFEGDDELQGKGGDDWLYGGPGNDLLAGGPGDDALWGEAGDDSLFGDGGRDRLHGGPGNDQIFGGDDDDWIGASEGSDRIDGGAGHDTFDARAVSQRVTLRYHVEFVSRLVRKIKTEWVAEPSLLFSYLSESPSPAGQLSKQAAAIAPSSAPSLSKSQRLLEVQQPPAQNHHQLQGIETILAPPGQANEIDFSFHQVKSRFGAYGGATAPPIRLDLSASSLHYGDETITVTGFRHGVGSLGDDWLQGDDQDNRLDGGYGQDCLSGGGGDDLLITHEGDRLTGGPGRDRFFLGAAWRKQSSRYSWNAQALEASVITDFNGAEGDRIHLESQRRQSISLSTDKSIRYRPFASLEPGAIAEAQFLPVSDREAIDPACLAEAVRLIYSGSSGELFYRGPEVFGGLNNWLRVAVLEGAPALSAADFWVV